MVELRKPKAYLTYQDNEQVRDLLLKKVEAGVIITIGDKRMVCRRHVPNDIATDLIERYGATIEPNTETRYRGGCRVFEIPKSKSKMIRLNGQKYIQIRLLADDTVELFSRISMLKQALGERGIKEAMCAWDRLGKITVDYERPQKTIKPEFDEKEMIRQRTIELEDYRETFKNY